MLSSNATALIPANCSSFSSIKELASHLTKGQAESILRQAMKLKTTTQVKRYMADQVQKISPNVAIMDTS